MLEIMVKRRKWLGRLSSNTPHSDITIVDRHEVDSYSSTDNLSDKISKMMDNKMLE